MKQMWKDVGTAAMMGLVVPAVLLGTMIHFKQKMPERPDPPGTEGAEETSALPQPRISVLNRTGDVVQMELDDYLTGVLLAELPADFQPEAKKAQAVVARTYALRAEKLRIKHEDAAVCMESGCCQGYRSPEEYLQQGGTQEAVEDAYRAVNGTGLDVLTYEGELIEATYFSCSGGSTEDAVAVWGTDVPYLQATLSPGEDAATHFQEEFTWSHDAFADALALDLKGDPSNWIGTMTHTAGGGVDTILIGGIRFSGTELRKILKLPSTVFSIHAGKENVTITTRGFGHRVGMSQYGADAMAAKGSDYTEILAHYYEGTALTSWTD